MDTPRRLQIASLATAVTSLGIGGLLLSRPSVEPVAPIVLDVPAERAPSLVSPPAGASEQGDDGRLRAIEGAAVVTPQTPVSLTSPPGGPAPAPRPAPSSNSSGPSSQLPAPAAVAPDDSGPSVDSTDSLDSD